MLSVWIAGRWIFGESKILYRFLYHIIPFLILYIIPFTILSYTTIIVDFSSTENAPIKFKMQFPFSPLTLWRWLDMQLDDVLHFKFFVFSFVVEAVESDIVYVLRDLFIIRFICFHCKTISFVRCVKFCFSCETCKHFK